MTARHTHRKVYGKGLEAETNAVSCINSPISLVVTNTSSAPHSSGSVPGKQQEVVSRIRGRA